MHQNPIRPLLGVAVQDRFRTSSDDPNTGFTGVFARSDALADLSGSAGKWGKSGTAGTRTQDQSLKRALLYQLSYRPNEPRMIAELGCQITGNSLKRTGSDRVRRRRQSRPPEGGRNRISRRRGRPYRPDSRTRSTRSRPRDADPRG